MNILDQDIKYLKGVGPARASLLNAELGISTVEDLLWHFPYKYVDRSVIHTIRSLQEDMPYVQLRGQILDIESDGTGHKRRLKATFTDGTGYIELVWFNSIKYIERSLRVNKVYLILGKPSSFNGRFSIIHPEMDEEKSASPDAPSPAAERPALTPHYHTTEKMKRAALASRQISDLVRNALAAVKSDIPETLPPPIIAAHGLEPLLPALRTVHFPQRPTVFRPHAVD